MDVEKKHVCPHCDFRTRRKYNLNLHIARIHKNQTDEPSSTQQPLEQELLEDSIYVLKIYNMLQKMKK